MSGGECCSLGSPALPALTSFALLPPGIAAAWSFPVPSHKLSSAPAIHHPHPPASCVFHPPPLKRPCPLTQPHTLACKRCRRATPRATGLDPPNRERTYRAEPAPLSIPLLPLPPSYPDPRDHQSSPNSVPLPPLLRSSLSPRPPSAPSPGTRRAPSHVPARPAGQKRAERYSKAQ